MAMHSTRKL